MERIRLSNMINRGYAFTEVHPVWPYAPPTFIAPILPAPNVSLPYPIPGALPIPAMPIFQNLTNNAAPLNSVPSNANLTPIMVKAHIQPQASQQQLCPNISNTTTNNSVNNNIQLLVKNTTKNVNVVPRSATDGVTTVKMIFNDNTATNQESKTEKTETKTSLALYDSNSSGKDSKTVSYGAVGDENGNSTQLNVTNVLFPLSPSKFNELARLALKGSEIAEKLAQVHRSRPCFKKIDNLCARMKQDLIRPDSVLPNINSQGIAWAVKDFIFVFTRVINAWIIIKGYVYNTPEGLDKIKQALSPEFVASFATWQDATLDFIENLIKSFVSLDNLAQSQKSAYQKTESASCHTDVRCSTLLDDSFELLSSAVEKVDSNLSNNYLLTMVEDSEDSQRQATVNGTYFKTGTYKPIKKDTLLDNQTTASTCSTSSSGSCVSSGSLTPISNHSIAEISAGNSGLQQCIDGCDIWSPTELNNKSEVYSLDQIKLKVAKHVDHWLSYDLHLLEEHQQEMDEAQERSRNLIDKLNTMIDRLMSMKNADLFFKLQFTKNYFPEFIARHNSDFMDVRSIILKCQAGGYNNIYEVVHDVKKIIYAGKEFLKFNQDQKLCYSVKAFEAEFNTLLTQPPFNCYNFEHIKGEPDECLY